MKLKSAIPFVLIFILILAGCSGDTPTEVSLPDVSGEGNQVEQIAPQLETSLGTLTDEQGAVSVAVTPLDLAAADGETLAFEVSMNTHSVDLSMELAALATLTTNDGRQVAATVWDAQPGGHHVTGVLYFPALVEGAPVLDEASQIILIIRDVDVPERVFTWQING